MDWNGLLEGLTAAVRDTFPKPVFYHRTSSGVTLPVTGVFDITSDPSQDGTSLGRIQNVPVLDIRIADLGFIPDKKDTVTIDTVNYSIVEKYPSSSGMMKLHLRKI